MAKVCATGDDFSSKNSGFRCREKKDEQAFFIHDRATGYPLMSFIHAMNWRFFNPQFEYEALFDDAGWPWAGHKFFAYDLLANVKPGKVVELGTHYGTSLWSFAQAAKDNMLATEFFVVDTWLGDDQAGLYGEEVFEKVTAIQRSYYSSGSFKIDLLRKTFNEALPDFADTSIDLLHIDGLHSYEAVRHDFEAWLQKMKKNGIILFHDIEVNEDGFGVHELWRELKEKYVTIEFHHSFGLGVLFLDAAMGRQIKPEEKQWQQKYSYLHEMNRCRAINQLRQSLIFMQASKFWKMRAFLLKLKKYCGF